MCLKSGFYPAHLAPYKPREVPAIYQPGVAKREEITFGTAGFNLHLSACLICKDYECVRIAAAEPRRTGLQ